MNIRHEKKCGRVQAMSGAVGRGRVKPLQRAWVALLALVVSGAAWTDAPQATAPAARSVAPGVWLIPGGMPADRQPDGNSVVFEAPDGLVVVDTGRHAWHRAALLALARAQGEAIVAVVNTHWHLDHVSGNPDLRAAYPGLRVYASGAIDDALAGFLAQSAKDSAAYLEDARIPAATREDIRGDMLTIANGAALRPDVVIERSATMDIGGRSLQVHLVADAVTAGDLWIYDPVSKVAVLGDLLTLPAPFLDTACPEGWLGALEAVSSATFEIAIPGHGPPVSREQFQAYRRAFAAFIHCANSAVSANECSAHWVDDARPLLGDVETDAPRARRMAEYYVGMLRENRGRSRYCVAPDRN